MKKYDIAEIFTDIDDKLIAGAKPEVQKPVVLRPEPRSKTAVWKKCAAAAACAAVVCGTVFAVSKIGVLSEKPKIMIQANSDSVEKVYDSLEINASKEEKEFGMSEFPGTEFKVSELGEVFIKPKGFAEFVSLGLWRQYPHSSVYLFDVTCDGKREICVASGGRVSIYDVAEDKVYSVSDNDKEYSLICAADLDQMPDDSGVKMVLDSVPPSFLPGADELGELREYPDSLYLIGATETDWETMVLGKNSIGKFSNFMTYAGAICIDWIAPPIIDNNDFEVTNNKIIANWERNNPVQIWDAADGEKTFTFEEFSELTVTINGDGVFFANKHGELGANRTGLLGEYYSADIVKMYSAYTADIDGDGERELCVLADLKTANGYSSGIDRFVLYYDMRFSWSVNVSGDRLYDGRNFGFDNDLLYIEYVSQTYFDTISSTTFHGTFVAHKNYDPGSVSWWYRIFDSDRCRVFDDFENFCENPTVYKDFEFKMEEYPESEEYYVNFKYGVSQRTLSVLDGEEWRVIMRDILSLYLVDVDGDGKREFCATVSEDWDWRKTGVYVYDPEEDKGYLFSSDDIQYAVSNENLRVYRSDSWKRTDLGPGSKQYYTHMVPISEAILPDFDVNELLGSYDMDFGGYDDDLEFNKWTDGDEFTYDGKTYKVFDIRGSRCKYVVGVRRDSADIIEFAAFIENRDNVPMGILSAASSPDEPILFKFDTDLNKDSHNVFTNEEFKYMPYILQPGETYYQKAAFNITEEKYMLSVCNALCEPDSFDKPLMYRDIPTGGSSNRFVDFADKSAADYDNIYKLFK